MAVHSSILSWRNPWTEEPGGLQSVGLQRVRHDGAHTHTHTREMSSLAGEGRIVGERSSPGVWSLPCGPQMDDKLGQQQ